MGQLVEFAINSELIGTRLVTTAGFTACGSRTVPRPDERAARLRVGPLSFFRIPVTAAASLQRPRGWRTYT